MFKSVDFKLKNDPLIQLSIAYLFLTNPKQPVLPVHYYLSSVIISEQPNEQIYTKLQMF